MRFFLCPFIVQANNPGYNNLRLIYLTRMNITIKEGYCYQEINRLVDVTSTAKAARLMKMARCKNVEELDIEEASRRGFDELADWAIPETDKLYLIDDYILVCIPKGKGKAI